MSFRDTVLICPENNEDASKQKEQGFMKLM